MEMDEEWRPVKDWGDIYEISNLGRIRSKDRKVHNYIKKGRILKTYIKPNGYEQITLADSRNNRYEKHKYIHIAVAEAFIPNPRGCTQVNHKDFNKTNNHVDNLEWVTALENKRHYRQSAFARKVEEKRIAKLHSKCFDRIMKYKKQIIDTYNSGLSVKETAKEVGVGKDFVSDVLKIFDLL